MTKVIEKRRQVKVNYDKWKLNVNEGLRTCSNINHKEAKRLSS